MIKRLLCTKPSKDFLLNGFFFGSQNNVKIMPCSNLRPNLPSSDPPDPILTLFQISSFDEPLPFSLEVLTSFCNAISWLVCILFELKMFDKHFFKLRTYLNFLKKQLLFLKRFPIKEWIAIFKIDWTFLLS